MVVQCGVNINGQGSFWVGGLFLFCVRRVLAAAGYTTKMDVAEGGRSITRC